MSNNNLYRMVNLLKCLKHLFIKQIDNQNCLALSSVDVKGYFADSRKRMNHCGNRTDSVKSIKGIYTLRSVRHTYCYSVTFIDADASVSLAEKLYLV